MSDGPHTHFGYQEVPEAEKARRVDGVFTSVAGKYDLMNDLMSVGMHRAWKAFTLAQSGVREGSRVLDIAGGTGDMALEFARRAGSTGEVWLTDINRPMLEAGRDRLLDRILQLRGAMDENLVRLRAAIEASNRRIDAVMQAIREQLAGASPYGAGGTRAARPMSCGTSIRA